MMRENPCRFHQSPNVADRTPLPVSAVVVARNAAATLPRCLGSVEGWVAEIVVVLNDTTDESEPVAEKHGAVVFETAWRGYRATQPWALALDADEEVSPALRAELEAFFRGEDHDRFAGARFPRKVWFIDRWITHGDWYPDLSLRLFHRGRARWGGDEFVHEKVEADGPVATLAGDLHHYSFPTLSSQIAKINPFADLFMEQQKARRGRFSLGRAVLRPAWRFFRAYVVKRGFLDGYPGFFIAWTTAFGALVRYSRLYEAEHGRQPPGADGESKGLRK
jgi:glycosyltransferase involved in cell wall biosynthesis